MKAFETVGEVDDQGRLQAVVPSECAPGTVRILVLAPEIENGGASRNGGADGVQAQVVPETSFMQWIKQHEMDAGIEDLAHQHDHYLHGTPKKEDAS